MLTAVDIQNLISPWTVNVLLAFLNGYFCYLINRERNKRQRTEMLLEQERNYISTILNTASALVVMLAPQGKLVAFNRACERSTGYIFAQVKDMYIWDALTIAEQVKIFQSALDAVVTKHQPSALEKWVTKSGDRRLISWTNTVMCDRAGTVKHFISTGIDISDRMQAEQMRESQKKYRSVVNNSKEVIFQLDEWRLWIFLNPAWTEITGFSIDESLNTPFHKYIHPDDCTKMALFRSLMQRHRESSPCDICYLGKDDICWLEVYARLNLYAYNNIVGISGNLNDVSDPRQTEEQIKAALQEKEVLLKEVYHRIKNNLHIINSLFRHQCRHLKNEQVIQVLKECQNRVISILLLHEKLYQSKNLLSISFAEYVKNITTNLLDSYNNHGSSPHLLIDSKRISLDFELLLN